MLDKSQDAGYWLAWAAAAQLQAGEPEAARALLREALAAGLERHAAARLLLGGASLSVGRAALLAERPEWALSSLRCGLELGVPGGIALCWDLLVAEAERYSQRGDHREAEQRWQDVAALLGAETPELVYRRMSDAALLNTQGRGGTPEENLVWGDQHKHEVLECLHQRLRPALYLEIGVDRGLGLARAQGPAIGLDPRPQLDLQVTLNAQTRIVPLSSDAFFREQAATLLQPPPGLVFIDGMHLFEFALRDFRQVERHAGAATLVVIDDVFPCHPAQAERRRRTQSWTGDVWKLHAILRARRPDLTLLALNAKTTGLLLVAGLDPDNRVLWDEGEAIIQAYREDASPPPAVLAREGALASDHPVLEQLVAVLAEAQHADWSRARVREALAALVPAMTAAQRDQRNWHRVEDAPTP